MIAALACGVLVVIAVQDVRTFRIRNGMVGLLVTLFGAQVLTGGLPGDAGAVWHLALAAAVFALMIATYAVGFVGAGDVKLMTAVMLWVGPADAVLFALGLAVIALASGLAALIGFLPVISSEKGKKIPFGPSIAGAGALVVSLRLLL